MIRFGVCTTNEAVADMGYLGFGSAKQAHPQCFTMCDNKQNAEPKAVWYPSMLHAHESLHRSLAEDGTHDLDRIGNYLLVSLSIANTHLDMLVDFAYVMYKVLIGCFSRFVANPLGFTRGLFS